MNNDNKMMADKQINLKPEKSVLKYEVGDKIKWQAEDFARLSEAFFAEMETKYL